MNTQDDITVTKGSVRIQNCHVPFRLRKNSRIKRSRLLVSPEEGLVVETPKTVNMRRAHKMITNKKEWVLDALESIKEKQKLIYDLKLNSKSVLIFGREKQLEIKRGEPRNYVLETKTRLILGFKAGKLKEGLAEKTLKDWFKRKAELYLPLRVRQLNRDRFKYNEVSIKDQKTLWGSCSSEKNINLNWRLVMAPRFASDYIIFHELCHTRALDHSPRYWENVKDVCPSFERAEKWFNDYGFVLHVDARLD